MGQMATSGAADTGPTFPQFGRLPPELRALIWASTWAEARVIEVASYEVDSDDTSESIDPLAVETMQDWDHADDGSESTDSADAWYECAYLRPTSRLSAWLEADFGSRLMLDTPFEECMNPVALAVCRESRMLCLERHTLIQHPKLAKTGFYLHCRSDVLCLLHDVDQEHLEEVQKYYGSQLGAFRTVFVEEIGWWDDAERLAMLFASFKGLSAVKVLLESYEFGDSGPDGDAPATEAEYRETAAEMRDRDAQMMGGRAGTIEYIDRRLNVYAELDLGLFV